MEWLYTLAGLGVGFIVGLTGVGGGSLMTPLLVMGFGMAPSTAVGTDLLYAALTKSGGTWVHWKRGNVDWKIAGWLACGSLPASLGTLWFLKKYVVNTPALETLISTTLGVALLATAAALLLRGRVGKRRPAQYTPVPPEPRRTATVVTGVCLGVLVTLSSVGAGALGTVALIVLYPRLLPVKVVGTDIVHAVPLTLVAGIGHLYLGTVDFVLLARLLAGSLPGIWLGSHLASRMPTGVLRPILACMLALIGGRLVF
jgi:uncharacterized protein